MSRELYVPETVTVHLGEPGSEAAEETVAFPDYIKNTAACALYPTWPESAVRAILYLQISHTLRRCLTGEYRQQGYGFDVTGLPERDLAFVPGRVTLAAADRIVDEIFNRCLCRKDDGEPFSFHLDGETATPPTCWTAAALAESGMDWEEILRNMLGGEYRTVTGLPVGREGRPFGGTLAPGDSGKRVRELQHRLNRVSRAYPSIPKINPADGMFGEQTGHAVAAFRTLFGMPEGEQADEAFWYRLAFLYAPLRRLSSLDRRCREARGRGGGCAGPLKRGDRGDGVRLLRLYLSAAGMFCPGCPPLRAEGEFDREAEDAVKAFQRAYRLEPDGVVGEKTRRRLERVFAGIRRCCPPEGEEALPPVRSLRPGVFGDEVRELQQYLSVIASACPAVPRPPVNGLYGGSLAETVSDFQREFGIPATGIADGETWDSVCRLYADVLAGYRRQPGQCPGFTLTAELPAGER